LSSWLRDYLYIPLGGNRIGPLRTHVNLMLTMLIGGLWHGASWTFVAWGGLHGAYLIGERLLLRTLPSGAWRETSWARAIAITVTFVLVTVAWVFFRASSFSQAFDCVEAMFGFGHGHRASPMIDYELVPFTIACIIGVHVWMRTRRIEDVVERTPWLVRSFALAAMLVAIVVMQGQDRAFIYFQF
jgi:alginate O-acetyltransferase complex protein AlgI